MKKTTILLTLSAAMMMMAGCGGQTRQVPFDDGDSASIANQDPTVYGICGEGTSMNSLQLLTDSGDTLLLDLSKADENGQVFGGLQSGDRMAVIPDSAKTEAVMVINQSTLLGDWVMPNPLDGSDEVGVSIKEGGVAEGIEQNSIEYRTWRLVRGQLELTMVRIEGSDIEESCFYDIVKLTSDSLSIRDEEDTFDYGRRRPGEYKYNGAGLDKEAGEDYHI